MSAVNLHVVFENVFSDLFIFLKLKKFLNTFIFERDIAWAGEGQRENETQNLKQAPGSKLSAQSPMWGLHSWTAWSLPEAEVGHLTEPPRHLCPFFDCVIRGWGWVLAPMFLDINLLLDISFAFLFHLVGCLLVLMLSFTVQKLFNFCFGFPCLKIPI